MIVILTTLLTSPWFWLVTSSLYATAYAELDPIAIKGSHFFYPNGTAFFIKGVAYNRPMGGFEEMGKHDVLDDPAACRRDIPHMTKLSINVLRVTNLLPTSNHSECMDALATAGIYVLADLSGIDNPQASEEIGWSENMLSHYTGVVSSLADYNNTLGFFIGQASSNEDIPFIKAAIRDTKQHLRTNGLRDIPVGFHAQLLNFGTKFNNSFNSLTCDENRIDFLGLVMSETYGTVQRPPYCTLTADIQSCTTWFATSPVPVVASETGCRGDDFYDFNYMSDFFTKNATETFSGAIVLSYYGDLVSLDPENGTFNQLPGYTTLSTALATATPSFTESTKYKPTSTPPPCPDEASWNISPVIPPRPNSKLCSCMLSTLRCVSNALGSGSENDYAQRPTFEGALSGFCVNNVTSNCPEIATDPKTGQYGAYSPCEMVTRYSWATNNYWQANNDAACQSNVNLTLRAPRPPPSDECASLLQQAGVAGSPSPTEAPIASMTSKKGSALSRSIKTGIVIGVTTFGALILVAILFWLRRAAAIKKKRLGMQAKEYHKPELEDTCVGVGNRCYEAPALNDSLIELPVDERPAEVASHSLIEPPREQEHSISPTISPLESLGERLGRLIQSPDISPLERPPEDPSRGLSENQ